MMAVCRRHPALLSSQCICQLLQDLLFAYLPGARVPHLNGGCFGVEPLVLVEANSLDCPLLVITSARDTGPSTGQVNFLRYVLLLPNRQALAGDVAQQVSIRESSPLGLVPLCENSLDLFLDTLESSQSSHTEVLPDFAHVFGNHVGLDSQDGQSLLFSTKWSLCQMIGWQQVGVELFYRILGEESN